jgi:hypothetical protein
MPAFQRAPVPGYTEYRRPVKVLFMSDFKTHTGSSVTRVSGHNTAGEIL